MLPTFKPEPCAPHPGQNLQWVADPDQGLRWISRRIDPESPTKNDLILYFRDPLLCLQYLMQSPLVKDHISFSPFKLYESATKLMRIYTEWLSGDKAWDMQVISLLSLVLLLTECLTGTAWCWSNSSRRDTILR
jgi:hypothetical protein